MKDSIRKDCYAKQTAVTLLGQLSEVYSNYQNNDKQLKAKHGITRLFRKWFISYNPTVVDTMHQEFLDNVEGIIEQLCIALEQLSYDAKELCNDYAAKVVNLMLAPKPTKYKTTVEWYMTIAEYQCACLLPYLAQDELIQIKNKWLERLPRRLMYPKQRELLKHMEKYVLSSKQTRY